MFCGRESSFLWVPVWAFSKPPTWRENPFEVPVMSALDFGTITVVSLLAQRPGSKTGPSGKTG
jgi:hypothetical protein